MPRISAEYAYDVICSAAYQSIDHRSSIVGYSVVLTVNDHCSNWPEHCFYGERPFRLWSTLGWAQVIIAPHRIIWSWYTSC